MTRYERKPEIHSIDNILRRPGPPATALLDTEEGENAPGELVGVRDM